MKIHYICRYCHIPAEEVDPALLMDATRKEAQQNKQSAGA